MYVCIERERERETERERERETYIHMMQVLTVQTPCKDEDMLYICTYISIYVYKYIHMMQVLTVQTPYKEEDMAALCDKLYCCPQLRLFVLESDQPLTADWVLCI